MTTILARKKNGKKCQSVTGFKNVEGVLSKHLKVGLTSRIWPLYRSTIVEAENTQTCPSCMGWPHNDL